LWKYYSGCKFFLNDRVAKSTLSFNKGLWNEDNIAVLLAERWHCRPSEVWQESTVDILISIERMIQESKKMDKDTTGGVAGQKQRNEVKNRMNYRKSLIN
jgi:hypothetical protein